VHTKIGAVRSDSHCLTEMVDRFVILAFGVIDSTEIETRLSMLLLGSIVDNIFEPLAPFARISLQKSRICRADLRIFRGPGYPSPLLVGITDTQIFLDDIDDRLAKQRANDNADNQAENN
jgi:hypothetical protein